MSYGGLRIPNGDLVRVAGHSITSVSYDQAFGYSTSNKRSYFSMVHDHRVVLPCVITRLDISFGYASKAALNLTTCWMQLWRKVSGNWTLIAQENILSLMPSSASFTTPTQITLDTPWLAKAGDTFGLCFTSTSNPGFFLGGLSIGNPSALYGTNPGLQCNGNVDNFDASTVGIGNTYAWTLGGTVVMGITAWGYHAPNVVFYGDSLTSGSQSVHEHHSFYDPASITGLDEYLSYSYPYQVAATLGIVQSTVSKSGLKTLDGYSAYLPYDNATSYWQYALAMQPKMIVILIGVNDILNSGENQSQYIATLTSMLNACVDNNIMPVVLKILPTTTSSNTQAALIDSYNSAITTLMTSYQTGAVIETSSMGQFRSGTSNPNNLWDLKTAYNAGDGLHLNDAGYTALATIVSDVLAPLFAASSGGEISYYHAASGATILATIEPENSGYMWNGTAFLPIQQLGASDWTAGGVALDEVFDVLHTSTKKYAADFPRAITTAGRYRMKFFTSDQLVPGGTPLDGEQIINWNGGTTSTLPKIHTQIGTAFAQSSLTISGTQTAANGTYYLVEYLASGTPYYEHSSGGWYLWHDSTRWLLTSSSPPIGQNDTGILPLEYWYLASSNPVGTYTAVGYSNAAVVSGNYSKLGTLLDLAISAVRRASRLPGNPSAVGDAMTLTSAYDAAKAAAKPGDQMDLVSGPNNDAIENIRDGLATTSDVLAVKAKTDNLPANPAAIGSAMTLLSAERDAMADALLDLGNAIDGKTLRQALQIIASVLAGKVSGAGSGTEMFRGLDDQHDRVVVTADASGNRTGVIYT